MIWKNGHCLPCSFLYLLRYGRRIFIASGLLLLAVISLLYLPAHTEYTLTAVRLLHGLAAGMIIPVAMTYAGEVA
jgi:MFS family permease